MNRQDYLKKKLRLNKCKNKRKQLKSLLREKLDIQIENDMEIESCFELEDYIIRNILELRKRKPDCFIRMKKEEFLEKENFFLDLGNFLYILLEVRGEASVLKIRGDDVRDKFMDIVEFDGDGFSGMTLDGKIIFSLDFDPDYPGGKDIEIMVSKIEAKDAQG